ncbi:MAG: hypothetical protein H3C62_03995 [Gemmatimonadaceae bacterium]|nr:hypothetical protein [Gemmatimonadaceae bacterium]
MTCSSTAVPVGDISTTAMELLSAAITDSVQTAAGSGAATWCPMYIGCDSRLAFARKSRSTRAAISASGRPSVGIASSSTGRWSGSPAVGDTGPSPFAVCSK